MTGAVGAPRRDMVRVALGERGYDILIGPDLIDRLGAEIAARFPRARAGIVTDDTVAALHLPRLAAGLERAGVRYCHVSVPPGERSKSFAELERVTGALLDARIERGDLVIAFGGGVVGDLAGFAAAILRRGVPYVQVPTTLLAQVDSSVGGKTAIDVPQGKNLIGAFHQPALVVADTALLATLPAREFRAGYAEIVKYGLIGDAAFFAWLDAEHEAVFAGGAPLIRAVARCCAMKAEIVAEDERETGRRALLNLGHTFGHALEAATGYSDRLLHGEAVAIGMALAFRFSHELGLVGENAIGAVENHLSRVGLPVSPAPLRDRLPGVEGLMDLIAQDKKVERGALTFILVRGIGDAHVEKGVDPARVRAFLARALNET